MNNGWIKLHRSFLDWEWYDDNKTFKLFIHLLLMANHEEKKYRGEVIKRGQVMTGVSLLAEQTKLSVKSVRTSLNKLKRTNEVAIETSPKGSIIQIVNYVKYQTAANEVADEGQTKGKQRATNNNVKNIKKENNKPINQYGDFLNWFNKKKEEIEGIGGRFKMLTKADENNLKRLKDAEYSEEDFNRAVTMLYKNEWARSTNNLTPSHFLRVENFNKYLNQYDSKDIEEERLYVPQYIKDIEEMKNNGAL